MAIVKNNPLIQGLSGKLQGVVFKNYSGRTFISAKPDMSNVVWTDAQKKNRTSFKAAQQYARTYLTDARRRKDYEETLRKGQRAYNQLIAEYMRGVVRPVE